MGAWGVGVFENDDAHDWVSELGGAEDFGVIERALTAAATGAGDDDDGPDVTTASIALAAAEVVAALRGTPGMLPEDATRWIATLRRPATPELAELARSAVLQIRTASQLKDGWTETRGSTGAYWEGLVDDLLARLE